MTGRICYLLCFRDPATGAPARYRHAGHYLGSTLAGRLEDHVQEHRDGRSGAVLPVAARAAGLDFKVTRTWPGGRLKERQLKSRSGARYCPDWSPDPEPGTSPRRPGATYLTRRQRAERQGADRRPLWELERTAVPVPPHACGAGCTCAAIDEAVTRILQDAGIEPRQEDEMFGRQARKAERERERQRAEADRLFAIADQLADQIERPNYQHEITTERAARIRERIGEDLVHDARAQAETPGPALTGGDLDAEVDRLAEMFPDSGEPGPVRWQDRDREAWDRYVTSQPGSEEHKTAYVDMHRAARGEGFGHADPDRGYLVDHGYQTDADRWAFPADYRGGLGGSAEVDWPGPEQGPDAARWGLDLLGTERDREPEPDICGRPGNQGGKCGLVPEHDGDHFPVHAVNLEPEPEPWDKGRDAARWSPQSEPYPLPRVLEPEESAAAAPDPTQLPDGTAHPNPFLAGQGWATQDGWYVRQPDHQLEAG